MRSRWTEQEAWDWYGRQPWIVGCNYIPSNSLGGGETWQEDGFEEIFVRMERELALASGIGMNSVRMGLPMNVWALQRDGLMARFERVLDLLGRNGMTMMPVFFDDCGRGPIELYSPDMRIEPRAEPHPGAHGGRKPRPAIEHSQDPTFSMVDDRANWPLMEAFVKDFVGRFAGDRRIIAWDLWNEPGNSGSLGVGGVGKSLEPMELAFTWAREMDPVQPLTAGCWDYYVDRIDEAGRFLPPTPIERRALELSDVVSYHYYGGLARSKQLIEDLKREWNRPLFITEWLHRPFGNDVAGHLPLYGREKVACYNWGLVAGKTQTYEPWDWIMDWGLDLSAWQHDLFNADGTPYREDEIALFKALTGARGDAQVAAKNGKDPSEPVQVCWEAPILIHNLPTYEDGGLDVRLIRPGQFGSQYARMLALPDGGWLTVYTIYDNLGYALDVGGGTTLGISRSLDEGKTWTQIATLAHPARDMDNGQMILAKNGDVLLSCRSVRWQESYQLPVYRSGDGGKSWWFVSMLDEHNGPQGSMGNPDKGMYEPHFYRLADGRLSAMYANERHVTAPPHYSQIISQRISDDDGYSWSDEIRVAWDCARPQLRPGMPVWLRMDDGRYIAVYEVVNLMLSQCESAAVHFKISDDGIHWAHGIGQEIPAQAGGPYIEQLDGGRLLVTSNSGRISLSDDGGKTWKLLAAAPFPAFLWASLYAMGGDRFMLLNACRRAEGGDNIQLCFGTLRG